MASTESSDTGGDKSDMNGSPYLPSVPASFIHSGVGETFTSSEELQEFVLAYEVYERRRMPWPMRAVAKSVRSHLAGDGMSMLSHEARERYLSCALGEEISRQWLNSIGGSPDSAVPPGMPVGISMSQDIYSRASYAEWLTKSARKMLRTRTFLDSLPKDLKTLAELVRDEVESQAKGEQPSRSFEELKEQAANMSPSHTASRGTRMVHFDLKSENASNELATDVDDQGGTGGGRSDDETTGNRKGSVSLLGKVFHFNAEREAKKAAKGTDI